MVLEPVLDAAGVEVVLDVAGQCYYGLLLLKLSKTDAALVLVR